MWRKKVTRIQPPTTQQNQRWMKNKTGSAQRCYRDQISHIVCACKWTVSGEPVWVLDPWSYPRPLSGYIRPAGVEGTDKSTIVTWPVYEMTLNYKSYSYSWSIHVDFWEEVMLWMFLLYLILFRIIITLWFFSQKICDGMKIIADTGPIFESDTDIF